MFASPASAQLTGTYTIGGSAPSFGTIDAAVTALNGGVSGPVTFLIRSGTYVPPSGGWRLVGVGGLSASNTVTFKPDAGATVTLTGNTGSFNGSGVFTFDGARYYIIDGSNTVGGTSKDMTLIQTEVNYNSAIHFKNNSDFNVVKNCNLQAAASSAYVLYGYGVVFFGQGTGNDNNTVQNCVIGDPNGVNRCYAGVGFYGSSLNTNNQVIGCDIINWRYQGVYVDGSNSGVVIQKNLIHHTLPSNYTGVYAIYANENSVAHGLKIDSNKIYKLLPSFNPSAAVYGIYINTNNVSSGLTQITNNMISLVENGYISYYGIALNNNMSLTSTTYTTNIYYNSVFFGGTAESFGGTYPLYRYSYSSSGLGQTIVNNRNNIYYSLRSGGNTTSYGLYVYSSPAGGFSSDYNLISLNTDNNYYTAYYNFSLYQTLASYKTSGQDVNSVGINPQFVDPLNGDLHISTTRRGGVESRGTNIAGFTTDFDGNTRNATTPDIGADEGTFLGPLAIDAMADRFYTPQAGAVVRSNTAFSPIAWVANSGTTSATVPIRFRILNSAGTVVYNDLWNYAISPLLPQRVTFNATGNNGGSTVLAPGTYTMELSTSLAGDGDAGNNIITGTLYVKDPLNGVYTIDKNGSGARNYTTFTQTAIDLSAVGMTGPVTFNISSGTYDSTTEVFPIKFKAISGASSVNKIIYKPIPGAQVATVAGVPGGQLFDLADADYITFDGSNTVNGTSRDWKIANSNSGAAIRFFNGAQYNTLTNLYMMAHNPSSTGVIYFAGYGGNPTGNSYNVVRGNTIGDSNGVFRSFANIYMTGDFSYRNIANVIDGNDIINWGANINSGGYGIYGSSYANELKIFRNRMRQTAIAGTTTFSGCYAIYISNFYNTNDTIAYNTISDLGTQTPLNTQIGIYFASLGQSSPEAVHNNMITLTQDGANAYGIYIGTASPSTFNIDHNSISIRGNNTTGSNYLTTTIRTTSSSTVTLRNNILMNERTFPNGTGNYVFYRGSSSGVFTSNNNIVYAGGNGTAVGYNYGTTLLALAQWQSMGYDATSTSALPPFVSQATGNLHINPMPVFTGEGQGLALNYQRDIDNQTRDLVTPDIGADDGDFNGGGLKLIYPNGGETFMPGDVVGVNYTANRAMSVRFEISYNGGVSWTSVGVQNPTIKGANLTNVTLPDSSANAARLRVISQRNMYEADTTDAAFRIVRKLKLTAANGGETWYVGDTSLIRWDRRPGEGLADYVGIEYSSDGGTNWQSIAAQIPMYLDSLPWIVPNTPTNNALIRITNREASRFWDSSNAVFTIANPDLHVVTPNGGEKYEMEQPVTVTWSSQNVTRLALLYSSDNGTTWQTIATDVDAGDGSYTFTPNAIPTKLALVRLIDMDRPRIKDQSDLTFEIMESKSIAVYSPAAGDKLVRGSTTVITWDAPRVTSVNILFSTNGGTNWQTIASNVLASEGSRVWTVPNQTTTQGMIRIQEVGGPDAGESGIFSIVDPAAPVINVIAPNGGEQFVQQDSIPIRWTASDVNVVALSYSTDGGNHWTLIQGGIPAKSGEYKWYADVDPGTDYRVEVRSTSPVAKDASAASFTITKKLQPSIVVLYPDGGENLTIDSTVQIRWTAQDIPGNVKIEISRDGQTWDSVAAAPASPGTYAWKVTGPVSTTARIRVSKPGLGITDMSNDDFEISEIFVEPIVVTSPNGGERWGVGRKEMITWTAPSSVTSVDIEYSTNGGGGTWISIATDVPSTGTNPSYEWTIPTISPTNAALVRVKDHAGVAASDISNDVFSIDQIAGVTGPVAGMSGLSLLGNYPNPFAGWTELRWYQGVASDVEIRIYQQSGTLVSRQVVGRREGGEQRYIVSGAELASGAYIYEIRAGRDVARGVMMLVR